MEGGPPPGVPPPPPPPPARVQYHTLSHLRFGPPPAALFPWQFATAAPQQHRRAETAEATTPSPPEEDGTCYFDLLPREVQLHVLGHLDEACLSLLCPLVSRHIRELAADDHLWRSLASRDFGEARTPNFIPASKYSDALWHRQPSTAREEYYYSAWKWYESYGYSAKTERSERFTETVRRLRQNSSTPVDQRQALLMAITKPMKLKRTVTRVRATSYIM